MKKIRLQCPVCESHISAPEFMGGKQAGCPRCGKLLTIPAGGLSRKDYALIFPAAFLTFAILTVMIQIPFFGFVGWGVFGYLNQQRAVNIGHGRNGQIRAFCLGSIPIAYVYYVSRRAGSVQPEPGKRG